MHVGPRQLNISQCRRLEGTIHGDSITRSHNHSFIGISPLLLLPAVRQRPELRMAGPHPDIFSRGTHADIVETTVIESRPDSHRHELDQTLLRTTTQLLHCGTSKLRTTMTVDALAFIQEDAEPCFGFG